MKIEVALMVSVFAMLASVFSASYSALRSRSKETRLQAQETASVIANLENISKALNTIWGEMVNMRKEQQEILLSISKLTDNCDYAHKRIDNLERERDGNV